MKRTVIYILNEIPFKLVPNVERNGCRECLVDQLCQQVTREGEDCLCSPFSGMHFVLGFTPELSVIPFELRGKRFIHVPSDPHVPDCGMCDLHDECRLVLKGLGGSCFCRNSEGKAEGYFKKVPTITVEQNV